jgi:uncharacterized protein (UPF0218 family)
VRKEIRKKLENEIGILIVDLKMRKQKILSSIKQHMDYIWKVRNEFGKTIKKLEEELTEEERLELSNLWENVDSILSREEDYWTNAHRIVTNEIVW